MTQDHGDQTGRGGRLYCWSFANAEFDEARWQLRVAGQDVELEHKPLEVLQHLLRHAGEAVTKDELLSAVWAGRVVVEAVLTNAIGKLRRALADEAQDIVLTLPRIGYRLAVPVARRQVEFVPDASKLEASDAVPRRPNWRLESALARTGSNEVWLARHTKTREARVFKFSLAGKGLAGLKREVTVARLLRESLGEREDFVRALDWDFEQAPYFIESEYGGASMDRWPGNGELASVSVEQRLTLFAQAAEAVAAAHSVGVLHKDLKPANLLIEGDGADARLRVADFGSSRLFDSGVLDELDITRLGLTQTQVLSSDSGTPLYLAPELVAGQSATIKSDVYALGVTLYQLLVGDFRRPLAPGWESDIDDPLLRQDIADAANGDPAKRLESVAALATRIRTIAARREKRALEDAVQARILEGEKRLAKARARRPWMIAAVSALVLAVAIMGWLLPRAWRSERIASEQRDVAVAMNRFVAEDILGAANPFSSGTASMSMREALDRSSPKINERFARAPASAASLHAVVADAYYQLSAYGSAARHYREARDLFKRGSSEPADAIDQQIMLAESLARSGQTQASFKQLGGLEAEIARLEPVRRYRAKVHFDRAVAWTRWQAGDLTDAVGPLEDAVANLALLPEPDPQLELETTQALLMARAWSGLPTKDLVQLQEAAINKAQASKSQNKIPLSMSARYGLLRVRMLAGEERSLEPDYRKMIAELTEVLGPRNEATLLAKHGLAHIYTKQERWGECQREADKVRAGFVQLHGVSHINSVNINNTQAVCLLGLGEFLKAHNLLLQALKGLEGNDGVKAGLVRVAVQVNLGHTYAELEKWDELQPLLSSVRKNGEKLLKADSDGRGEVRLLEGRLAAARGNIALARSALTSAIEDLSKKNPPDYWLIKMAQRELGKVAAKPS